MNCQSDEVGLLQISQAEQSLESHEEKATLSEVLATIKGLENRMSLLEAQQKAEAESDVQQEAEAESDVHQEAEAESDVQQEGEPESDVQQEAEVESEVQQEAETAV